MAQAVGVSTLGTVDLRRDRLRCMVFNVFVYSDSHDFPIFPGFS